jgi:FkbM family methyltransferase
MNLLSHISSLCYAQVLRSRPHGVREKFAASLRRRLIHRWDPVVRVRAHGVPLYMRLSHVLPMVQKEHPYYDSQLPRFASLLYRRQGKLIVIDVGANIGDTTVSIAAKAPGQFLCIDGDPRYFDILLRNTRGISGSVSCEMVLCGASVETKMVAVQEASSTSVFLDAGKEGTAREVTTIDALVRKHPEFAATNLIKVDTDGFDYQVLRGALGTMRSSRPALFFELDPEHLTRVGDHPLSIFSDLREIGYHRVLFYDNFGLPVCTLEIDRQDSIAAMLGAIDKKRVYYYDALVLHEEHRQIGDEFWESERSLPHSPAAIAQI